MDVGLPPAPPIFQYAEAETRDRVLSRAGFIDLRARDVECVFKLVRAEMIERLAREGLVRTRLIFDRQTPDVQRRIIHALVEKARGFETGHGVEIPNAAHIVAVVKSSA